MDVRMDGWMTKWLDRSGVKWMDEFMYNIAWMDVSMDGWMAR